MILFDNGSTLALICTQAQVLASAQGQSSSLITCPSEAQPDVKIPDIGSTNLKFFLAL